MNEELSKVRAKAGRAGGLIGGASRSAAKVAAARANGRLGGRPRKRSKMDDSKAAVWLTSTDRHAAFARKAIAALS